MNIPKDVREQMLPMPADFAPEIHGTDKAISWRGKVTVSAGTAVERLQLEIGLSTNPAGAPYPGGLEPLLRLSVWEAREVARLGRVDLLAIYRVDRHKMRPTPQAQPQPVAPST